MSAKYTEQREWDSLELGERWACTFCGPLNAGEHARGLKATITERRLILAIAFEKRLADLCNYIDDKNLKRTSKDVINWLDPSDDREWHYSVRERQELVDTVSEVLDVFIDVSKYQVGIMLTQYNTRHYVTLLDSGMMINPDPNLTGNIVERRPFVY